MSDPTESGSTFLPERLSSQAVWHWQWHGADGAVVRGGRGLPEPAPRFTSQGDAETWLGESWRDLLEAGVESVTLQEGDRDVYGPMSLRPPS